MVLKFQSGMENASPVCVRTSSFSLFFFPGEVKVLFKQKRGKRKNKKGEKELWLVRVSLNRLR